MRKISETLPKLQAQKSAIPYATSRQPRKRRFTKRVHDLIRVIPKTHLRDTYLALQETMDLESRTTYTGNVDHAQRCGLRKRQLQRNLGELVKLGVVVRILRKAGRGSNHTNILYFPELEEFFSRAEMTRGGVMDDTVKQLPEIEIQDTTPLPPKGGGEWPSPDPIAAQALHEARRLRQERKAQRRRERHARPRAERRSRSGTRTPVQLIAARIMAALRICPALSATRAAVEASVVRWAELRQRPVECAYNALVAAWKDYEWRREWLEYPCGMLTFFGEFRWVDGMTKAELRSWERRKEASMGSVEPSSAVDIASLRSKMSELLSGVDDLSEDADDGLDEDTNVTDAVTILPRVLPSARRRH